MFKIKVGPLIRQYAVVIVANLSVLCVGLGLAWPSPVLVKLRNETETVLSRPITEEEGSWIVSIGLLSGFFANLLACYLVDRIGRKCCIILGCVPRLAMCFIFTFSTELWMLLLGRAVSGVADAFIFTVVPMYASEIASKQVRGALGTILQIFSSIGIVTMLSMGPFTPYVPLNVIFTCIVIITTIPLLFLPDSPYFLYSKGRNDESVKLLTFLRGSESLANEEIKEYSKSDNNVKVEINELFKNKVFVKTVCITIILGAGTQLTGFNAVTFYLQTVLDSTQTSVRSEIASVIIGAIQLAASFCTTFSTDRFGRKSILITTTIGMTIGMFGLGTFFKLREQNENFVTGFMNFVPLFSLILVVFCYSAGIGSINWLLTAELFDGPARAVGVSISLMISIIVLFITTKYFASLTLSIGAAATYWLFSVNCVLFCLFIILCVPETKGKTFAEIQIALGEESLDCKDKDKIGNTDC